MGPDENENGTIYMLGADGVSHPINKEPPTITIIDESSPWPPADPFFTKGITMSIRLVPAPKHHHCHSRKRLIKLLMGWGLQRNDAASAVSFLMDMLIEPTYQRAWNFMRDHYGRYFE